MNARTAKLLRRVAAGYVSRPRRHRKTGEQGLVSPLAQLKAMWLGTPRPLRGDLRRRLQAELAERGAE